jgi:peptidase E
MNNFCKSVYLLSGGPGDSHGGIVDYFAYALSVCGKKRPRVAYIGVASGDDSGFYNFISPMLVNAGAGEVVFPSLASTRANVTEAKAMIAASDAVFISGGDVEEGMKWLNVHNLCEFLLNQYRDNKLFFGASAGSIMLGLHWVRWSNPDDDSTAELFDCLGIVQAVFDTHAEDDGWNELKMAHKLLLERQNNLSGDFRIAVPIKCYGIPSGCMMEANSDGHIKDHGKCKIVEM